jgi:hypothetical protein
MKIGRLEPLWMFVLGVRLSCSIGLKPLESSPLLNLPMDYFFPYHGGLIAGWW